MNFVPSTLASFLGSMLAIIWWFHFDMEDHWRLWKARRGRMMEERARRRDALSVRYHEELLEEEGLCPPST